MVFIKSESGRYFSLDHIIGFAIEEGMLGQEGRRIGVFKIIAYLPEPLQPAVIGTFLKEESAAKALDKFIGELGKIEHGKVEIKSEL